MATDERLTFDLHDARALHLECISCGTTMNIWVSQLGKAERFKCPICNPERPLVTGNDPEFRDSVKGFFSSLAQLAADSKTRQFRIGLQFPGPAT